MGAEEGVIVCCVVCSMFLFILPSIVRHVVVALNGEINLNYITVFTLQSDFLGPHLWPVLSGIYAVGNTFQ